jgi:hypothetical protein
MSLCEGLSRALGPLGPAGAGARAAALAGGVPVLSPPPGAGKVRQFTL